MLNEDFDKVVDLCMEQAGIWREQRAARVTDRKAMERELVRLEAAISRLTDALEQGQPVGTRLRERPQELTALRWKLDEPEATPTGRRHSASIQRASVKSFGVSPPSEWVHTEIVTSL